MAKHMVLTYLQSNLGSWRSPFDFGKNRGAGLDISIVTGDYKPTFTSLGGAPWLIIFPAATDEKKLPRGLGMIPTFAHVQNHPSFVAFNLPAHIYIYRS